jgi:hypothetical protein
MLSDQESEKLADIERSLAIDDPAFAQIFHTRNASKDPRRRMPKGVLLAVLVGTLALVIAWITQEFAFATASALLGWMLAFSFASVSLLLRPTTHGEPKGIRR